MWRAAPVPVQELGSKKNISIDHQTVDGADHLFADHVDELTRRVAEYLKQALTEAA